MKANPPSNRRAGATALAHLRWVAFDSLTKGTQVGHGYAKLLSGAEDIEVVSLHLLSAVSEMTGAKEAATLLRKSNAVSGS